MRSLPTIGLVTAASIVATSTAAEKVCEDISEMTVQTSGTTNDPRVIKFRANFDS